MRQLNSEKNFINAQSKIFLLHYDLIGLLNEFFFVLALELINQLVG